MSLFRALLERRRLPGPLTTYVQGVACFYLAFGLSTLAWPGQMQVVFQARPFVGDEESLFRVLGMTVAVIGWMHLFAGRDASRPVIAASVIDRLLVPAVLVPLALDGVFPVVLAIFAVLDPIFALVAWALLVRAAPPAPEP